MYHIEAKLGFSLLTRKFDTETHRTFFLVKVEELGGRIIREWTTEEEDDNRSEVSGDVSTMPRSDRSR